MAGSSPCPLLNGERGVKKKALPGVWRRVRIRFAMKLQKFCSPLQGELSEELRGCSISDQGASVQSKGDKA